MAASCQARGVSGAAPAAPRVALSEIMYHPVLENGPQDNHEFIELHNPSVEAIALQGWRLVVGGQVAFRFPAGTTLGPGRFLVVAKNRTALLGVAGLRPEDVVGDFEGGLDNGGDEIVLADADGARVDVARYDDKFPWPIGADALGAGRAWWPPGEYEKHQYKGRSLERRSYTVAATEPRNWEASALGGGTPGRANGVSGDPPAIVMSLEAHGRDRRTVAKGERATVSATLSPGQRGELAVEYFVDDLGRPDDLEPKAQVAMSGSGSSFTAELPVLPERSIVRYRIVGARGGPAPETISPRAGDPFGFHAFYVQPDPPLPARSYQVFVTAASWTRMWSNLGSGPNVGCELNPGWDARVPAVVIYEGTVYDVLARYQGSRYQRRNGFALPPWPAGTGPTQPPDLKALSWRFSFPSSRPWREGSDRRATVTLNKQHQACPGVLNLLESKLLWAAGIRTQRLRFARLYVNGAYYQYMMEIEDIDEDLLGKTDPPGAALGDLFKLDGAGDDNQGPWARANFWPLGPNTSCPARWSALDRYRFSYERQSLDWKDGTPAGHDELIRLIEQLTPLYNAAKASGDFRPVRAFLSEHFDVPQLITQWAIRNFAGVWDDGFHNLYLYKRPSDGRYEGFPQDFDLDFGGDSITPGPDGKPRWAHVARPANSPPFAGEEGAGNEPVGGVSRLKSALIKAFREEFRARFTELMGGVLKRENVSRALDEAMASWDQRAWDQSPAIGKCDVAARVSGARTWLEARYAFLAQQGIR